MEFLNKLQFVTITHHTGFQFQVRLSQYEIEKANSDPAFLEEIAEKYYKLYKNNIITSVNKPLDTQLTDVECPIDDTNLYNFETDLGIARKETEENFSTAEMHDCLTDFDSTETVGATVSANFPAGDRYIWPREAVLLLLEELLKRKDQLGQPHKKRVLFGEIGKVLNNKNYKVSWESCERKWRGLQTMYKKKKNNENKSGNGAVTWEFYNTVEEIIASDPAYNPITTAAVGAETVEVSREPITKVKKSQTSLSKDFFETAFKETNNNIHQLRESLNEFKDVQVARNQILARVATALEKLTQ